MSDGPFKLLDSICYLAKGVVEIARTAKRNSKSLKSDNFYGKKFHDLTVDLAGLEVRLNKALSQSSIAAGPIQEFNQCLTKVKSAETLFVQRNEAFKRLQILSHAVLKPAFETPPDHPTPEGEHVLPFSVVKNTRGYIEKVVIQANACYDAKCFDACSVMIRKLVEMLLIELHEAKSKQAAIKNVSGDYFMLSDLINATLQDQSFNFARETKQTLPKLKTLGDRAAHNRRYLATKSDVDGVVGGLRVVVDDLLHLAALK